MLGKRMGRVPFVRIPLSGNGLQRCVSTSQSVSSLEGNSMKEKKKKKMKEMIGEEDYYYRLVSKE